MHEMASLSKKFLYFTSLTNLIMIRLKKKKKI